MSLELKLGKQPMTKRLAFLLGLLAVLILVVMIQYLIYPQWLEYQQVINEKKQLEHNLQLINKMTGQLSPEKRLQLLNELKAIEEKLGSGLELGQVVLDLADIEKISEANIIKLEFLSPMELEGFMLDTISLQAKGNFTQIIKLIKGIEGLPYYTVTTELKLETEKKLNAQGKPLPVDANRLVIDIKFGTIRTKDQNIQQIDPKTLPMEPVPFSTTPIPDKR